MQIRSCELCGKVYNLEADSRAYYGHACLWDDERVDTSEWTTAKEGKNLRPRFRSGPMLRVRNTKGEWVR